VNDFEQLHSADFLQPAGLERRGSGCLSDKTLNWRLEIINSIWYSRRHWAFKMRLAFKSKSAFKCRLAFKQQVGIQALKKHLNLRGI